MEPMENIRIVLARRIKQLRKARGVNQEYLAEKSGLSIGTIKLVETHKRWPSPENMEAIASGLGVTVSELFEAPSKVEQKTEPISIFAKRILNIPDSFYETVKDLDLKDEKAWSALIGVAKGHIELKRLAKEREQGGADVG